MVAWGLRMPRLIAIGLLILSAATVYAGIRGDVPRAPRQEPAPVLWMLGGLVAQLVLLHPAGFAIASGLLFWLHGACHGEKAAVADLRCRVSDGAGCLWHL